MAKFRHFEESRVHLGVGEIHIQEVDDGVHLTISEEIDHSIRIGIPDEHGISYNYWRDIVRALREEEPIKMAEDVVELDEIDEVGLKEEAGTTKRPLRPVFVQYKDNDIEWIAIKLKDSNADPFLVSWEKNSDMPIPVVSFNLDLIDKSTKIGQTVFYQEFQKICKKVLAGS